MRVIGLMSGTSADGVDAALVDIRERAGGLTISLLASHARRYPPSLQRRIVDVSTGGRVDDICHLHAVLGEWFARAALRLLKRAALRPRDIALIGSHGQTIHHLPHPRREPGLGAVRSTLQIASPAVIAERTGITTVSDFRSRDVAAGGEGAPLTPYLHALCFGNPRRSRLIVNLGGICNVTYVPAGGQPAGVVAFDTGPANMVLDLLATRLSNGRLTMDRGGRWAASGRIQDELLRQWLRHPYLQRRPPKSTGREEFGEAFVKDLLNAHTAPEDLLATATRLTAVTIADARRWLTGRIDEVIVGGGGIRNRALMRDLAAVFSPTPVRTFDDAGYDSAAFEAMTFAVLAYQSVHGRPANLPAVTGARRPVVLGSITPGAHARTLFQKPR